MMEQPVNILLVDDQEANLDVLQAILTHPDHHLVRATTGEQALLALLNQEFAAVVLDIRMPDVSGLELAQMIKQRRRTQHVPILFLTAHLLDDKDVQRGYGVGAVDYLSKPINPDILRSKIGVFVELFRKTRDLAAANLALEGEIGERQRAQEALRVANEALEARVQARTADLMEANQELAQYRNRLEQLVAEQTQRLRHSLEQLRQSERLASVGTLATGIAHEINNPLNAILLATQFAIKAADTAEYVSALENIRDEAIRAGQIVKNLLRFTREEQTTKTPNDINGVIQRVAALIRSYLPSVNTQLELELTEELPPCAINTTEIEQVVVNLIKNAAEANAARVTLRTARVDGAIHISVEDDGPGIPTEFQPHIFDPFFTTKRTSGGTGLGLSLSHGIIAEHGGRIAMHSVPGRGSTFTIELPALEPSGAPVCQES